MNQPEKLLQQYFGHASFRTGQKQAIDAILSGRDVLAVMPTGAGKSVCYQISALLLRGVTIVISPLISLMKDQVEALRQVGIPAAYVNSSITQEEFYHTVQMVQQGQCRILYVAPERLMTESFFRLTQQVPVSMIAVDEAHCVSQWGQDFRQSYLDIPVFMEQLPARPICTAFTATATKQVEADIARILKLQEPEIIHTGFDRKNLFFGVRRPNNKTRELFQLLRENDGKSGIVYCSTRKAVEEVCDALRENGFPATRYHAGLSDTERAQNQDDFLYDRQPIMVATNASGMGIDKSNVSFVIHYNMPMDLESYYQEAGRAGRDGSPAQCILLYSGKDVRTNDFLLQRSRETTEVDDEETRQFLLEQGKERLKQMTFYATSTTCLRHRMLQYFGDHSPDSCGNCSCCLTNYREEDATTAAKKIISCVYRAQKGGYHLSRTMTADVLMGSKKESLLRMRLDQLSTYGIIEKLSRREVMQLIDELIQREDLALRQFQEYQELVLTAGGNKRSYAVRGGQRPVPEAAAAAGGTGKARGDSAVFHLFRCHAAGHVPEKAPEPRRDAAGFRCGCHQGTEVRENVSGGVAAVSDWGTAVSEQICVSIDSSVQIKTHAPHGKPIRAGHVLFVRCICFLRASYAHALCGVALKEAYRCENAV